MMPTISSSWGVNARAAAPEADAPTPSAPEATAEEEDEEEDTPDDGGVVEEEEEEGALLFGREDAENHSPPAFPPLLCFDTLL